jgi:hypothetical protein
MLVDPSTFRQRRIARDDTYGAWNNNQINF